MGVVCLSVCVSWDKLCYLVTLERFELEDWNFLWWLSMTLGAGFFFQFDHPNHPTLFVTNPNMLTLPILVQFGWKNVRRSRMDSRAQIQSYFFLIKLPHLPYPYPPPPLTTPKYKFCQFCSNLDETWCGSKEWIAKLKSRFILFIWLPQITPTTLSPTPLTQLKLLTKMGKLGTWNGRVGGIKWRYWGPEMGELGA